MLVMMVPLDPGVNDTDAAAADDDDDDSSLTKTSGSLRNKKYPQSKCTFSSIAAVINASITFNGGVLLSEEE